MKRVGLIAVTAILTPFLFDVVLSAVALQTPPPFNILYVLSCLVLHCLIVGLFAFILHRLLKQTDVALASFFTVAALVMTRLNQLMFEEPFTVAVYEGATLLAACLLVFGLILWRIKPRS